MLRILPHASKESRHTGKQSSVNMFQAMMRKGLDRIKTDVNTC